MTGVTSYSHLRSRLHLALGLNAIVIVAEFIVHYHIDWGKEQLMKRAGWHAENAGYWTALGLDQLLHQLTYVAIVTVLAGKIG